MKLVRICSSLMLLALFGCAAEPFPPVPLPPLSNPDPKLIREAFAAAQPKQYISDDTLIIQAPFHDDMAFLGVLQVDRIHGTFELIGLTHMGVKLFDLAGDRNGVSVRFAVPPLLKHPQLLTAFATDIYRTYFDLEPPADARVEITSTEVIFTADTPKGRIVYEFGGEGAVLLDKHADGLFGADWRVRYFQYNPSPLGLYPRGIVVDNHEFHYRIIVKNRDLSAP